MNGLTGPLVSVIVPAYNAERYIEACLDSILGQTYPALEVVVVDDGSRDRTADLTKSYAPRVTYVHQPNSGSCAAPRNTGLDHISGEFITFFDADDVMVPDKVERQVAALTRYPDAVAAISNYRNFSAERRRPDHFSTCPKLQRECLQDQVGPVLIPGRACREILIEENFSCAGSPLVRATCVQQAGGFDTTLMAAEDFHFIYRVALCGPVIIDPEVGYERRLHGDNMSGDNERMLRNYISSRTMLIALEPDPALRAALARRIRYVTRGLQGYLADRGRHRQAWRLFGKTLPPRSWWELGYDLKTFAKLGLPARLRAGAGGRRPV